MPVPRIIVFQLTIMLAATIAVVTSAHAASDADREMVRVYADAMTNAVPTLANVQEEMEKDCSSMSGPSGVSSCIHGLDLGAAGVRTVRSRMSGLKVPDCLRGVDAQLRVALDLLRDGYAKAQKGLVAWMPVGEVMPVQDMEVMYSGMRDIEIGNEKITEATALLKAALVICPAQ
jgi:hypothetical protein